MDDIYRLDGPRFFRMAWRLSAYGGVVTMRLQAQQNAEVSNSSVPERSTNGPGRVPVPKGAKVVELADFMANYPDVVEMGVSA